MRYSFDITIPASTPVTSPHEERLKLETGTLTRVFMRFKAGCHNRVYVVILDSLHQIVPASATQALYGDNVLLDIPMQYDLPSKPYELTVRGWSPDTRYDHVITVWLDLIELSAQKDKGFLGQIAHLLGG